MFSLRVPRGSFLHDIAEQAFALGSPRAILADPKGFELKPVGSGPYEVAEWVRDDHITLVANPKWAGPKPAYQTVIIRDIPDQATSVLSIQKGDIDMLTDPRPDDAKALTAQPGLTVDEQPANNTSYIALQMEKKPFGDIRVRQAIAYALDVQAMAANLYSKGAVVANTWLPPGMLGDNPAVKAYPHDVAKAKALLAAAGFPHGFTTSLSYPTSPRPYLPEPQRVAEAIQADLKAAGIQVTLQPDELGVFLDKIRHGEHEMCLIGWTGDNGDPDNFLYPLLDQDSARKDGTAQNYSAHAGGSAHRRRGEAPRDLPAGAGDGPRPGAGDPARPHHGADRAEVFDQGLCAQPQYRVPLRADAPRFIIWMRTRTVRFARSRGVRFRRAKSIATTTSWRFTI